MNEPWHFQLLGTLSAKRSDQIITRFATSRAAALLTRLALFPHRTHPREELIDLLWPNRDIDSGRLNLRVLPFSVNPPGSLKPLMVAVDPAQKAAGAAKASVKSAGTTPVSRRE